MALPHTKFRIFPDGAPRSCPRCGMGNTAEHYPSYDRAHWRWTPCELAVDSVTKVTDLSEYDGVAKVIHVYNTIMCDDADQPESVDVDPPLQKQKRKRFVWLRKLAVTALTWIINDLKRLKR